MRYKDSTIYNGAQYQRIRINQPHPTHIRYISSITLTQMTL